MLDDDAVLEYRDLGVALALVRRFGAALVADHHDAVDGLAAGQELGLGQDRRTAAARVTTVAAALTLGLQTGGSADALDLVGAIGPLLLGARGALMHDGVGRIVACLGVVAGVVAGSGLAAAPTAPAAGRGLTAAAVLVCAVLVRFVLVCAVLACAVTLGPGPLGGILARGGFAIGCWSRFGCLAVLVRRLSPAPAAAATAPAAPAIGRAGLTVAGLVVLLGIRALLGILGNAGVLGLIGRLGPRDGLRRDEKRHVGRGFLGLDVGLEDQPRFGLAVGDDHLLGGGGVPGGQQVTDPDGVGMLDAGLGAAGPVVELGEHVEHLAARGAEHPGQGVDPQLFRQVLIGNGCGLLNIVGHVFSLSPRARRVDAATRGLAL